MTDSVWVHNLNPFLVHFSHSLGIRWYGLAYLVGFVAGALFMIFMAKRGRGTLRPEMVTDFITYVVLGTMIGGRLGYALFYGTDLLTDFSLSFPFWGVLRVWEGGMASHGGIAGIFAASLIFSYRHRVDWRHLGDLTTLGGSIGIFFGRIANFINGELFGREASPTLPWAVKFPGEMYLWLKSDVERKLSDPAPGGDQLLKMTNAVKSLGTPSDDWSNLVSQVRASSAARSQAQNAIDSVINAIQNGNETARAALAPYLTARHPSQIYEALLEGLLLFVIAFVFWRKPRKPGVVAAVWMVCYSLVRIFGEHFRMPDAHIGYQLFGLTRGQWLSVLMLAISVFTFVIMSRRKAALISGWGAEARKLLAEAPLGHQGDRRKR